MAAVWLLAAAVATATETADGKGRWLGQVGEITSDRFLAKDSLITATETTDAD